MSNEQIYNPADGIDRMMTDVEDVLNPIVSIMQYLFSAMSSINSTLVIGVFISLLYYMVFVRHHHIKRKLKKPKNYLIAALLLAIYVILTEMPMKINSEFSLNLGFVVMPLAAKMLGPILACAFGIIQYATSFIMHSDEVFNLSSMLVAGINGMLYGWIIYAHRTTYIRCLWALVVNMVCNLVLVPLIPTGTVTSETLSSITMDIVINVCLAPALALLIYVALRIMRKIRKNVRHFSWSLSK